MKQHIYEDLWRRLGKFAPAKGTTRTLDANGVRESGEVTEAWTEFDGELDRLAQQIDDSLRLAVYKSEMDLKSRPCYRPDWPPMQNERQSVARADVPGPNLVELLANLGELLATYHEHSKLKGRA